MWTKEGEDVSTRNLKMRLAFLLLVFMILEGRAVKFSQSSANWQNLSGPLIEENLDDPNGKPYKVVCYFASWASFREGAGRFLPENINSNLCTHVVYAFANLDANTLEIRPRDADTDIQFYQRVTSLANRGVRVLLGLGGWKDSAGQTYSRLVNSPTARAHFIAKAVEFVQKYRFTGLDLDWEFPTCWQADCTKGPAIDKVGFAKLVTELKAAFKPRNWLLTIAGSQEKLIIDKAYDIPTLNNALDWVNVMAYDYHGSWEKRTGHVAPLYHHNGDANPQKNAYFSAKYWLGKGLSKNKLVLGMPLYGITFTLINPNQNGLNAPASGPGLGGPITKTQGQLAFYEICNAVRKGGWKVTRVADHSMGPYASKGNQWMAYDDVMEIVAKSKMIKTLGLAGGMVWAVDFDDFKNTCSCGSFPLLSALSGYLNGGQYARKDCAIRHLRPTT